MREKKNLADLQDILSVEDVCSVLGIGRNSVYKLLQDNEIASKRIRRKYIIPKASLTNYIDNISDIM